MWVSCHGSNERVETTGRVFFNSNTDIRFSDNLENRSNLSFRMADRSPNFLTFADLMSAVGGFMFHWSLMEQGLTDAITEARELLGNAPAKVKGSFAERIDLWANLARALPENVTTPSFVDDVRAQAMNLKDIRNLITHGMCGGDSQPNKGDPHIICIVGGFENPSGVKVRYSFAQLEDFTQGIDACRRSFIRLRNFNYRIALP